MLTARQQFLVALAALALAGLLAACGGTPPAPAPTPTAPPAPTATAAPSAPPQATATPAGCWITATTDTQVYQRPSTQAAVFGVLPSGEKVEALYRTNDQWYGFDPGIAQAGNVGIFRMRWIQAGQGVQLSGNCNQLPVAPPLPANVCFVVPMTNSLPVYASPTTSAQQLGALGPEDYAAAIGRGPGAWVKVNLDSGKNALSGQGWVSLDQAGLTGPCDNLPQVQQNSQNGNAPSGGSQNNPQGQETRIKFAKGAISWQGAVNSASAAYVFYAAKGQSVEILLTQGNQPANAVLTLKGADGKVLQDANVHRPDWRGVLPKTQDYHLQISAPNGTSGLTLTVTIYPLPQEPKQVQDTGVGYRLVYDGKYFHPEKPGYFANEIFGLNLAYKEFFMNTNLEEAYYVMSLEPINDPKVCLNTPPEDIAADAIDTWRVNGVDYRHYHSAEGAAGNFYTSEVFRTYVHLRCVTVYLFTHTTDVTVNDNVTPYDEKGVMDELKRVFYTLVWP